MSVVIQADQLSKRFYLRHNRAGSVKERFIGLFHPSRREVRDEFWALRELSLEVHRGEALGIIGSNGSGKSTLLKLIAGIHRPTDGAVRLASGTRIGTMIELGIGFHPELSGRENVYLSASVHGLTRAGIDGIYDSIVAYAGLDQFIDQPLKNYSSGMQMRLGFSISVHLRPDVLLLDEVFAVGDADFQQRCIRTMREFQDQQRTILFVSHSDAAVRQICRRACLLDHGRLQFDGSVDGAFAAYDSLRLAASPAATRQVSAPQPLPAVKSEPAADSAWYRQRLRGDWDSEGDLQLEFLRGLGLRPDDYLLDVGCGALRGGTRFIRYLEPGRYYGIDSDLELVRAALEHELPRAGLPADRAHLLVNGNFTFTELPRFDVAFAYDLWPYLSLNAIGRCTASVMRQLKPGGRFVATFWEHSSAMDFKPVVRAGGMATSLDRPPYHYPFDLLYRVAEAAGARMERLGTIGSAGMTAVQLLPACGRPAS